MIKILLLPFTLIFIATASSLIAAQCIRPKCPYFKSHSPNRLFDQSFISDLAKTSSQKRVLDRSIPIYTIRNGKNATLGEKCYSMRRVDDMSELPSWCHHRPCYELDVSACTGNHTGKVILHNRY